MNGVYLDSLWIDWQNGFTPIRHVVEQSGRVESEVNVSWKNNSGVWVPVSMKLSKTQYKLTTGKEPKPENFVVTSDAIELTFLWEELNSPAFDQSVFDYRSFDLPEGTPVFDERSKPSKQIDTISRNRAPEAVASIGPRKIYVALLLLFIVGAIGYTFRKQLRW